MSYLVEIVGPHGVMHRNQNTLSEARKKGVRGIVENVDRFYTADVVVNIFRETKNPYTQKQVGFMFLVEFNDDRMFFVYRDRTRGNQDKIVNIRDGTLSDILVKQAKKYGGIHNTY